MSDAPERDDGSRAKTEPAIEFRDVVLAYDDRVILDGISFTVQPGETKIVLGGSGTGKSTILKLALGLIKPDSGHIFVEGEDVTELSEQELILLRRKMMDAAAVARWAAFAPARASAMRRA